MLLDIQKGVAEDTWGWRWEVTNPEAVAKSEEQPEAVQEVVPVKSVATADEVMTEADSKELNGSHTVEVIPEETDATATETEPDVKVVETEAVHVEEQPAVIPVETHNEKGLNGAGITVEVTAVTS